MTPLTAKQESFIEMMKKNDELARKGFQLLLKRDDYPQFFALLDEAGFFAPSLNPSPVSGERENTVRIPYWPALDYLKAAAKVAGAKNDIQLATRIIEVIRAVSSWRDDKDQPRRNHNTNRIFAEIIGLLPSNVVTLEDIDLLPDWLNDPYERMLVANALDDGALPRFLNSAEPADWEKAVRILHHVTAIEWHKEADDSDPTPASVVDDYWLQELLRHHSKQIGRKSGESATGVMLERVREVFSTQLRRDHSSAFRPAVEDHVQNHDWRSVENLVVEGLRDVLLGWVEEDAQGAQAIVRTMLNDELQMIRRVGIYVVSECWGNMRELYGEVARPEFFASGQNHELYHLLQDHFAEMSTEQKEATVQAIENLPEPKVPKELSWLRKHGQYRWYSAIKSKGYQAADQRFAELDADPAIGKLSDHPDFDSYISSRVGPGPTPYSPEELIALAKTGSLIGKLNDFVPADEWRGPTIEGLTSALENAVRSSPEIFLSSLPQFMAAKFIFQHAVINGFKQAWEAKSDLDWGKTWPHLIDFFEQLVSEQRFWEHQEDTYQHWVVTIIADCLHAGTRNDDHAYDPALLPRTQAILAALLQKEPGAEAPQDDAMTQALNTSRGRIQDALFSQALRAARISEKETGAHQNSWETVRPLFEDELSKCSNGNYEFSTFCGSYLPQLQYLDNTWTTSKLDLIFPAEYLPNTICALDGLAYAAFTQSVYELLTSRGIMDRALALELRGRDARSKLVERVAAAYLWGVEKLDGPRFEYLLLSGTIGDFDVMTRVFWFVRNDKLSPEQRQRILNYWDRILKWARNQAHVPERLISMLSLLASHITILQEHEKALLHSVAPYVHVGHESYEFVAELLRLAPQDPSAIRKTLELMVASHKPDYDYQDRLRSLLAFLAEHGERDAVLVISNQLRHLEGIEGLFKSLTQH